MPTWHPPVASLLPTPTLRGRVFALPSLEGKRVQANRKVHRLFNGVMATSLLRPHLVVTASCKVLVSREWAGRRVGRGHAVTGMGWARVVTFCLACKHSSAASQGGQGQLPVPETPAQGAHKTGQARPLGQSWEARGPCGWGRALLLRPSAHGTAGEGEGALR